MQYTKSWFSISSLLFFSLSPQLQANEIMLEQRTTTVIADLGGVPIGRNRNSTVSDYHAKSPTSYRLFPVVSRLLRVGQVTEGEAKAVKFRYLSHPIFMIGYDAVSINWLQRNKPALQKARAIGYVVQVATEAQFKQLQHIAGPNVILQPISGDGLAQELDIRHYPFYVDRRGVMRS